MVGMGRKKFTKIIKARVDDETYMKAKELADMMTNGKLAELIRKLIKVAYGVEKTEDNGSSNCSKLPLFLEVMAPTFLSEDMLFYTTTSWGFENKDAINKCIWDGCCGVIFYIENINGENYVIARTVVKRGYTEQIVNIIKDALKRLGADTTRLKVRVYDPCKCQG